MHNRNAVSSTVRPSFRVPDDVSDVNILSVAPDTVAAHVELSCHAPSRISVPVFVGGWAVVSTSVEHPYALVLRINKVPVWNLHAVEIRHVRTHVGDDVSAHWKFSRESPCKWLFLQNWTLLRYSRLNI